MKRASPQDKGAAEEETLVDRAAIQERFGGDADLWRELIEAFHDERPRLLADARQAAAKGNANHLARAAHTLKGTVGTLGAIDAYAAAQQLEMLARGGGN